MPTKRGVALVGARAITAMAGIAVAVVTVGAAQLVEWPTVSRPALSTVVEPQPSEQLRVCPGPLLTLGDDPNEASTATSIGSATTVSAARAGASVSPWTTPEVADIRAVDNAQSARDGAPLLLSVPVEDGTTTPPLVAGSQSQAVLSETIGGFAAAACAEAVSESWLVGGSTDIGHTSLVLLTNPTSVVASVDLTVYGETGRVDAPGSTGILVQPSEQRIISLAGLAPNLKSPIVQVQATGGQIAATLEESLVRGIDPGGVELVGPTAAPADDITIAGVRIPVATGSQEAPEAEEFSDETPTVRVLVPGPDRAEVQVGILSEDGEATGASQRLELEPGIATEIPLTALAAGVFTVRLQSDQPLVAAARTTSIGTTTRDFGWFAASEPLSRDFAVSVAPGPSPTLHLYNRDRMDATLSVLVDGGSAVDVEVAAGQSVIVPMLPSGRYTIAGGSQIVASVGYSGDGALSSFALNPPGPLATPIRVYSR